MSEWANNKSILISQIFTVVWALLLAALDVGGWWILHWFGAIRNLSEGKIRGILVLLYLCSVLGWLLLHAMWKLLKNLGRGQVYTKENVKLLNRVSWCCAGAAILCLIGVLFYPPFLFAVAAAGFMAMIVRVVRNILQHAVRMKDELDLMI